MGAGAIVGLTKEDVQSWFTNKLPCKIWVNNEQVTGGRSAKALTFDATVTSLAGKTATGSFVAKPSSEPEVSISPPDAGGAFSSPPRAAEAARKPDQLPRASMASSSPRRSSTCPDAVRVAASHVPVSSTGVSHR